MNLQKRLQRARDLRSAVYVSLAVLWTYAIVVNFHYWHLGAIAVTIALVEIWYDNISRQIVKEYRKEKGTEQVKHNNND